MNKVNLERTYRYFVNDPRKLKVILKWGFVVIAMFSGILFSYLGIFFFSFFMQKVDSLKILGVFFPIFFCGGYIVSFLFMYGSFFISAGLGLNNYKKMRYMDQDEFTFSQLPKSGFFSNLFQGLKYYLISFLYFLPFIFFSIICILFFVFSISYFESSTSQSQIQEIFFTMIFVFSMFFLVGIQMLFMYFVSCVLKPIIFNLLYKEGFWSAINPILVMSIFLQDPKKYLINSLYLFLLYILWFSLYIFNVVLIYLCIGIFLFPFIYGFFFVIKAYLEPHIVYQITREKKIV